MAKNPYKGRDSYTERASKEGYVARSVYKLKEIDKRFRIFKQGMRVVDLGCSPGSWSKYAHERVGRAGCVVGVDINAPQITTGPLLIKSILDITPEEIGELLGGVADVVLSDMAPLTTGVPDADHLRQIELAYSAFQVASTLLKPGGSFVVKVFEGGDAAEYQRTVKARFGKLKRLRPEAVRKNSREFFMVATGFRG
jgi:23S rRNA (uridine2552-2'-O)-methyltransferase